MAETTDNSQLEPISYRNDLINAAIGKLRLTNDAVAKKATEIRLRSNPGARPMAYQTVATIRDGDPNVRLSTLKEVVDAVSELLVERDYSGMTLADIFQPAEESVAA